MHVAYYLLAGSCNASSIMNMKDNCNPCIVVTRKTIIMSYSKVKMGDNYNAIRKVNKEDNYNAYRKVDMGDNYHVYSKAGMGGNYSAYSVVDMGRQLQCM